MDLKGSEWIVGHVQPKEGPNFVSEMVEPGSNLDHDGLADMFLPIGDHFPSTSSIPKNIKVTTSSNNIADFWWARSQFSSSKAGNIVGIAFGKDTRFWWTPWQISTAIFPETSLEYKGERPQQRRQISSKSRRSDRSRMGDLMNFSDRGYLSSNWCRCQVSKNLPRT